MPDVVGGARSNITDMAGTRDGGSSRREAESPARLLTAAALAAVGAALAAYLAADQVGAIPRVWDPIFGSASSQRVLHSWLSRSLPVPDAALGAAGYVGELVLVVALLVGARGGRHPWLGLAYGALAMSMALVGAVLVAIQALSLGAFCSLCLMSAALSWVIAALAFPMLTAGVRELASQIRSARSTSHHLG